MPPPELDILALEPWFGGSHRCFLEGWQRHSRHHVRILGLPPRHWRWRMQASALTLAERAGRGPRPDLLWVSDYIDLARLRGFLPPDWRSLPTLAYFHENQLTYPQPTGKASTPSTPDLSPGFANILTAIAADDLVFSSRFHLEDFARAARELLARLPRPRPRSALERALGGAAVVHPGIDLASLPLGPGPGQDAPLRIVWCHRWEHDKDPASFLRALRDAREAGGRFELVLLGEGALATGRSWDEHLLDLAPLIRHRGFADDRSEYVRLLGSCDLVVATAHHEFYGISLLEAVACGCAPLAPRRLAYPETLSGSLSEGLYASKDELVQRIVQAAHSPQRSRGVRALRRMELAEHDQKKSAAQLDDRCTALLG